MLHSMNLVKRLGLAVLLVAISVGMVNLPATASASSTAAAASPAARSAAVERSVVNQSACASASKALPKAKKAAKKATKVLAKKKKALKKAKKANRAKHTKKTKAKAKRAKKAVTKAKRSLKKKHARVQRLRASKSKNCAEASSGLSADQLGQLLALLSGATGGGSDLPLNIEQLTDLLDKIVPGGAGAPDPAMLMNLLAGFNSGALDPSSIDPAALAALLGGLSPDQLTDLLGGAPLDPATALAMFQTFVDMFGGLAGGGFELPGDFDPTNLLDTLGGLLGGLLGGDVPGLPDIPGLPVPGPLCDLLPLPIC